MKRTKDQNSRLHSLLTSSNLMKHKADLAYSFSEGRTSSTSELTIQEAAELIKHLQKNQVSKGDRMRKKIIHYSYLLGWETGEGKADINRIDAFCIKYSKFHKKFNDHNLKELPVLVSQFESMYRKYIERVKS